MGQITLTYNVASGSGKLRILGQLSLSQFSKISYQAVGDNLVDGEVTVNIEESDTALGTYKVIGGSTALVNQDTDEYIDAGDYNSAHLQFDIAVGTAENGILTFTLTFKQ